MNILGIIPARGDSKGIPGKNITDLSGKPLLSYTCEAALGSQKLTRIILDTDSEEIANIGRDAGVDVPFLRPAELAKDDTPIWDVLRHTVDTLEKDGFDPEVIVLLQPTSPLRTSQHIDEALKIFEEYPETDTVVSMMEIPHQYVPRSLMVEHEGILTPLDTGELLTRRQDKDRVLARNGPAILAFKKHVLDDGHFYDGSVRAYVMDLRSSTDIDCPLDLEIAEFFLQREA